eukprot:8944676-Pyramimonas_sp.AAC.1
MESFVAAQVYGSVKENASVEMRPHSSPSSSSSASSSSEHMHVDALNEYWAPVFSQAPVAPNGGR